MRRAVKKQAKSLHFSGLLEEVALIADIDNLDEVMSLM